MELKKVTISEKDSLSKIKDLYEYSFPPAERREFDLVENLLRENPQFVLYAIEDKSIFVGFISIWKLKGFSYVEHFAIDSQIRSKGYGSATLQQLEAQVSTPIVLEVELPEDEMSKKRITFYERLGYNLLTIPYMQPPYRKGESGLPMYLMTKGIEYPEKHFEHFVKEIYQDVYNQPV